MKKVLPVAEPIADAHPHLGMEFSMFMSDEKYYPWLINNFIQLYTLKDMQTVPERGGTLDFFYNRYGDWEMFQFSANPYLAYEKIVYSTIKLLLKSVALSELLEDFINENKYALIPIDLFTIKLYDGYQKFHRVHNLFIVGYDNEEKVFYTYDNFKGGKYRLEKVTYDEITIGYETLVSDEEVASWSEHGGICSFRFYKNPWHEDKTELYDVNMNTILNGIREYLMIPEYCDAYSHISYYRYGVDCYKELVQWLRYGQISDEGYVDHRAFCAMRDHKRVMIFRLEYIQKRYKIELQEYIKDYEIIKTRIDIVIMKILKGNKSANRKQFAQCIDIINEVSEKEIVCLQSLLNSCVLH